MAINSRARTITDAGNLFESINPSLRANPLGWLGQSIAIYADQDPFWEKFSQAEKGETFLEKHFYDLPLALHCEVKNPLGLAAFLTTLRGFAQQTAPGMTVWNNSEYKGQPYVKVSSACKVDAGGDEEQQALSKLAIYYASTPKSLVLTLNEAVLKRALDRQAARSADVAQPPASAAQWLGTNLCLQVNREFLRALESGFHNSFEGSQQQLAWRNLPVLNEWKRRFPSEDPVKLHEALWHVKLVCPGGGDYVWNEKWQTMESTVYGHPGEPRHPRQRASPLQKFSAANLGLTFENEGLSAKVVLTKE